MTNKKRKATGQMAIFAILIFQSLFMLFAMSLNIALVVHDKINLQNSVDMAAYYGAMKQAEMMNAIAHINYQIRQSWKLLTWRYRVLGSFGVTDIYDSHWVHGPKDQETEYKYLPVFREGALPGFPPTGPYNICLQHEDWTGFFGTRDPIHDAGDNICTKMSTTIPRISNRIRSGPGGGWGIGVIGTARLIDRVNIEIKYKCEIGGISSWFFAALSFGNLRKDQAVRKQMIYKLAEKMSDGKELTGGSIAEGAIKTLVRNLSYINKKALREPRKYINNADIKIFNSLKDPQKIQPAVWLEDYPFEDVGLYADVYAKTSGGCDRQLQHIAAPPEFLKNLPHGIDTRDKNEIERMVRLLAEDPLKWPDCARSSNNICKISAGLSKLSDFKIFYAVKAEISYKNQVFLPFNNSITLKAKAYAKPFGGRIGPPRDSDGRLPPVIPGSPNNPDSKHGDCASATLTQQGFDDPRQRVHITNKYDKCLPNYSRFPGDQQGLISARVHHNWAPYLKSKKQCNQIKNYVKQGHQGYYDDRSPLATAQFDLHSSCSQNNPGLDYNMARLWELAAIAPDFFDITYFTILPNYQEVYFKHIEALIQTNPLIRGDLETYHTGTEFQSKYGLLSQVGGGGGAGAGGGAPPSIWSVGHGMPRLNYKVKSIEHLLTGWNPPKTGKSGTHNYMESPQRTNFQKCRTWAHRIVSNPGDPKGWIAGGCVQGGRTGYSVKLVNPTWFRGTQLTGVQQKPPW